jgi:hypothetical protein
VVVLALALSQASGEEEPAPERLRAPVDSLAVEVLDTFPAQIDVVLGGWLPDACARIELVEETVAAARIELTVNAIRPSGVGCAQLLTQYSVRVPLAVAGFGEGEYVVAANGAEGRFTIEPIGDFPVLSLPAQGASSRLIVPSAGLAFVGPSDWERTGLTWRSPSYLSSRIGLRWREIDNDVRVTALLPEGAELHESSESRLGWATGERHRVSRTAPGLWSEHLFVPCGDGLLCEFWMEAPSEPLLEAAGEAFWRLVRFVARLPT